MFFDNMKNIRNILINFDQNSEVVVQGAKTKRSRLEYFFHRLVAKLNLEKDKISHDTPSRSNVANVNLKKILK